MNDLYSCSNIIRALDYTIPYSERNPPIVRLPPNENQLALRFLLIKIFNHKTTMSISGRKLDFYTDGKYDGTYPEPFFFSIRLIMKSYLIADKWSLYRSILEGILDTARFCYQEQLSLLTLINEEQVPKRNIIVNFLRKCKFYRLTRLCKTRAFCEWYYHPDNIGGKISKKKIEKIFH
jgi:hypothetical protein